MISDVPGIGMCVCVYTCMYVCLAIATHVIMLAVGNSQAAWPRTFIIRQATNHNPHINQFPENTANMLTHRKNVQKLHMEMLPETRAILSEFYRPFNEMLVELTGDRGFHW